MAYAFMNTGRNVFRLDPAFTNTFGGRLAAKTVVVPDPAKGANHHSRVAAAPARPRLYVRPHSRRRADQSRRLEDHRGARRVRARLAGLHLLPSARAARVLVARGRVLLQRHLLHAGASRPAHRPPETDT